MIAVVAVFCHYLLRLKLKLIMSRKSEHYWKISLSRSMMTLFWRKCVKHLSRWLCVQASEIPLHRWWCNDTGSRMALAVLPSGHYEFDSSAGSRCQRINNSISCATDLKIVIPRGNEQISVKNHPAMFRYHHILMHRLSTSHRFDCDLWYCKSLSMRL